MVERQIGFEPEKELANLLLTKDPMDIMLDEFSSNATTEYNVLNTYIQGIDQSTP